MCKWFKNDTEEYVPAQCGMDADAADIVFSEEE
jgi:hypothetical protein